MNNRFFTASAFPGGFIKASAGGGGGAVDNLLMETGDQLLFETGDAIQLE